MKLRVGATRTTPQSTVAEHTSRADHWPPAGPSRHSCGKSLAQPREPRDCRETMSAQCLIPTPRGTSGRQHANFLEQPRAHKGHKETMPTQCLILTPREPVGANMQIFWSSPEHSEAMREQMWTMSNPGLHRNSPQQLRVYRGHGLRFAYTWCLIPDASRPTATDVRIPRTAQIA